MIKREFLEGRIVIYNADCADVMREIGDKGIDLILTDPPYNTTACDWDHKVDLKLWQEWQRITKDNMGMIFTASQPFTSELILSNKKEYSHQWIWQKNSAGNALLVNTAPLKNFEDIIVFIKTEEEKYNNDERRKILKKIAEKYDQKYLTDLFLQEGRYKNRPSAKTHMAFKFGLFNGKRFDLMDEKLFNYLKKYIDFGFNYEFLKKSFIKKNKSSDKRVYNPQGIIEINKKKVVGKKALHIGVRANQEGIVYNQKLSNYPKAIIHFDKDLNNFHPTQKPVALFEYLIKTYSNENDLIFDGFLGSGTTVISAIRTNRRLIGAELDPIYFEKMCFRIEEELRQPNLF